MEKSPFSTSSLPSTGEHDPLQSLCTGDDVETDAGDKLRNCDVTVTVLKDSENAPTHKSTLATTTTTTNRNKEQQARDVHKL